jgi:hypothetical protein
MLNCIAGPVGCSVSDLSRDSWHRNLAVLAGLLIDPPCIDLDQGSAAQPPALCCFLSRVVPTSGGSAI